MNHPNVPLEQESKTNLANLFFIKILIRLGAGVLA